MTADDRRMTFRELNEVTDIVATGLRHRGVRPDSIVGIYMERSLEYTISYIAILKAGVQQKKKRRRKKAQFFLEKEKRFLTPNETRSSVEATAVRSPPPPPFLSLVSASDQIGAICVHCIWPKWPLEHFSGGGSVISSQPAIYMYTLYLSQMAFGALQWGGVGGVCDILSYVCTVFGPNGLWSTLVGGGGVCDIQPTCHMCTLYLAQMAFGAWSPSGGGGGVRVTTKWLPCRSR